MGAGGQSLPQIFAPKEAKPSPLNCFGLLLAALEIIGGRMAALSKSAVGPIWLGRRLEKNSPKN